MKSIRPETTHGIVNRVTTSLYSYQAWPTVAQDEKGTLYAVASGFRIRHVDPFGKTVMYISRNGGKTWTPPIVINDTYLDDRDAGILYLGNGKLLVSWFTRNAEEYSSEKHKAMMETAPLAGRTTIAGGMVASTQLPAEVKAIGSHVRVSEDYGVTWGETYSLPVTAPHGPTLCRDGSLIYLGTEHRPVEQRIGTPKNKLFRSRDDGKTWQEVSTIQNPAWLQPGERFCEPHILELSDGKILAAVRVQGSETFSIATAISEDGGVTWSEFVSTDVSGAPPHLLEHSSGAVICTFGRREPPYGEYAMISHDLGKTWTEEYVIDDNTDSRDLGYGSTVELPDGSLLTVYYQRCPGDNYPSILYTKWKL